MAVNKRNSGTKARANTGTSANAGTKANAGATPKKKTSRITGYISDLDCYLFGAGTHYDIYQKLGAIPRHTRERTASILQFGLPMPGKYIWWAILTAGTLRPTPWLRYRIPAYGSISMQE